MSNVTLRINPFGSFEQQTFSCHAQFMGNLFTTFERKHSAFESVLSIRMGRMNDFDNSTAGADLWQEAKAFISCMADQEGLPGWSAGWNAKASGAIAAEIDETGTYSHTSDELQFGARLAWRNSNRCIGRHSGVHLRCEILEDMRTFRKSH
jgi:hypothetical protein